jgi:hypothetical protein
MRYSSQRTRKHRNGERGRRGAEPGAQARWGEDNEKQTRLQHELVVDRRREQLPCGHKRQEKGPAAEKGHPRPEVEHQRDSGQQPTPFEERDHPWAAAYPEEARRTEEPLGGIGEDLEQGRAEIGDRTYSAGAYQRLALVDDPSKDDDEDGPHAPQKNPTRQEVGGTAPEARKVLQLSPEKSMHTHVRMTTIQIPLILATLSGGVANPRGENGPGLLRLLLSPARPSSQPTLRASRRSVA